MDGTASQYGKYMVKLIILAGDGQINKGFVIQILSGKLLSRRKDHLVLGHRSRPAQGALDELQCLGSYRSEWV